MATILDYRHIIILYNKVRLLKPMCKGFEKWLLLVEKCQSSLFLIVTVDSIGQRKIKGQKWEKQE